METRKEIRSFGKGVLKLRQQLQDGRIITKREYHSIKSDLEALLLDLEMNHKKGRPRTH